MKRIFSSCLVCLIALTGVAFGATGRVGVNGPATSRMPTMSIQSIGVTKVVSDVKETPDVKPDVKPDEPVIDRREKERLACLSNNIGIGNTFVWASRYSDINNYATMVEDVEHPENNTCFVFVGLTSTDAKIDLSDINGKYFEMGQNIVCGSWVNENDIEQRILDAKKKNRTLATIGGAVGGAAVGVGAMELFGNKTLAKHAGMEELEGQKMMDDPEILAHSQVEVLCGGNKTESADCKEAKSIAQHMKDTCDSYPDISQCQDNEDNKYVLALMNELTKEQSAE